MRRNSSKSHLFKKIPQAKTCYLLISPSLCYLLKHLPVFLLWCVFHALFSYLRRSSPDHFTDPFRRLWLFSIAFEVRLKSLAWLKRRRFATWSYPVFIAASPHQSSSFNITAPPLNPTTHYSNRNEAFVIMAREGSQRSLTSAFLVGTLAGQGRSPEPCFTKDQMTVRETKRGKKRVLAPVLIPETLAFKAIPI